jgi:L-ribulose-5-phosphate 3-epimerase UlaE
MKIDWTQEPFSEIEAEFKAMLAMQIEEKLKCNAQYPGTFKGFVITENMTHFTSLSETQEDIFNCLNLYVKMEDMQK